MPNEKSSDLASSTLIIFVIIMSIAFILILAHDAEAMKMADEIVLVVEGDAEILLSIKDNVYPRIKLPPVTRDKIYDIIVDGIIANGIKEDDSCPK